MLCYEYNYEQGTRNRAWFSEALCAPRVALLGTAGLLLHFSQKTENLEILVSRAFDWLSDTFEIATSTGLLAAIFNLSDSQSE